MGDLYTCMSKLNTSWKHWKIWSQICRLFLLNVLMHTIFECIYIGRRSYNKYWAYKLIPTRSTFQDMQCDEKKVKLKLRGYYKKLRTKVLLNTGLCRLNEANWRSWGIEKYLTWWHEVQGWYSIVKFKLVRYELFQSMNNFNKKLIHFLICHILLI